MRHSRNNFEQAELNLDRRCNLISPNIRYPKSQYTLINELNVNFWKFYNSVHISTNYGNKKEIWHTAKYPSGFFPN